MKLLVRLLVVLGLFAVALGPGRDYTGYAVWWLTNGDPPEVSLNGPPGAVRGAVEVTVETRPAGRVEVVAADLDGRELPLGTNLRVDTSGLPDGPRVLTVRTQDHSLRRNSTTATLRFASDNTPPSFEVEPTPREVSQGRTLVVHVRPNEPAQVQVSLGGTPLKLFPAGSEYWAVIGINPDERPGQQTLNIEGRDQVGNAGKTEQQVSVKPFNFTRDALQVPAAMLPLLAPEIRAAEDERLAAVYRADNGPPRWKGPFLLPVLGKISTEFGEVRSYNGGPFTGNHIGTDFQAGLNAPVQAPANGKVLLREEVRLRGRILVLDHGGGVYSTYAHLADWLVEPGQEVQAGQPVARVGSSGLSTGPHLHWEVWVGGRVVDPLEWTEREIP